MNMGKHFHLFKVLLLDIYVLVGGGRFFELLSRALYFYGTGQ